MPRPRFFALLMRFRNSLGGKDWSSIESSARHSLMSADWSASS